jgi:hypothetical protein
VWDGAIQKFVVEDGTPKGMRAAEEETGADRTGLRVQEMQN